MEIAVWIRSDILLHFDSVLLEIKETLKLRNIPSRCGKKWADFFDKEECSLRVVIFLYRSWEQFKAISLLVISGSYGINPLTVTIEESLLICHLASFRHCMQSTFGMLLIGFRLPMIHLDPFYLSLIECEINPSKTINLGLVVQPPYSPSQ